METPKSLQEAEEQLAQIIRKDRKDWVRIARLLLLIEEGKLYEERHKSFTGFVRHLSISYQINIATLWRIKSAATTYMEVAKLKSVGELHPNRIRATPEQLALFRRLSSIAPEQILENLRRKMLEGGSIRQELQEAWSYYRPLKRGKTERGRKKRGEMARLQVEATHIRVAADQLVLPTGETETVANQEIAANRYRFLLKDLQKTERFNLSVEEVKIANMKNALRDRTWAAKALGVAHINGFRLFPDFQLPINGSMQRDRLFFQAIAIIKKGNGVRSPMLLAGISMGTNPEAIDKLKRQFRKGGQFCDLLLLAVPEQEQLVQQAETVLKKSQVGILTVGEVAEGTKHQVNILRRPELIGGAKPENRCILLEQLLLRALSWA